MYRVEKTDYGFKVTTTGDVGLEEIEHLKRDMLVALTKHDRPFALIIDARHRIPLDARTAKATEDLHKGILLTRVQRVAIIVDSPIVKGQEVQIAYNSHSDAIDRIIDASKTPDWEHVAVAWAADGIEPDTESSLKKL